jgi:hypothetical protein
MKTIFANSLEQLDVAGSADWANGNAIALDFEESAIERVPKGQEGGGQFTGHGGAKLTPGQKAAATKKANAEKKKGGESKSTGKVAMPELPDTISLKTSTEMNDWLKKKGVETDKPFMWLDAEEEAMNEGGVESSKESAENWIKKHATNIEGDGAKQAPAKNLKAPEHAATMSSWQVEQWLDEQGVGGQPFNWGTAEKEAKLDGLPWGNPKQALQNWIDNHINDPSWITSMSKPAGGSSSGGEEWKKKPANWSSMSPGQKAAWTKKANEAKKKFNDAQIAKGADATKAEVEAAIRGGARWRRDEVLQARRCAQRAG